MRITNKIMQNNSLSNINTNKILQDKLNNNLGVYVYDKSGKNLYVAKGRDIDNEETEEFE